MASDVGRTSVGERLRSVMGIAARGGDLTQKEMGELKSRFQKFMREADISGAMLPGMGAIGQIGAATRTPAARFLRKVLERGVRRFQGPEYAKPVLGRVTGMTRPVSKELPMPGYQEVWRREYIKALKGAK